MDPLPQASYSHVTLEEPAATGSSPMTVTADVTQRQKKVYFDLAELRGLEAEQLAPCRRFLFPVSRALAMRREQ